MLRGTGAPSHDLCRDAATVRYFGLAGTIEDLIISQSSSLVARHWGIIVLVFIVPDLGCVMSPSSNSSGVSNAPFNTFLLHSFKSKPFREMNG